VTPQIVSPDIGPSIDWASEGLAGVVAVFNGGFERGDHDGGASADGLTFSPLVAGDMSIALNADGAWRLGPWGSPGLLTGFSPIAVRQNLAPLLLHGQVATSALVGSWGQWGWPLKSQPLEPRTGLGVDAANNLLYVASVQGVLPATLAQALLDVGARRAMALDMNPYWPILGASFHVLHRPGPLPVQIPFAEHNPSVYFTGWTRDFFVAFAQSTRPNCRYESVGLRSSEAGLQPQPLRAVGAGCERATT
jgi:hypothetical protein